MSAKRELAGQKFGRLEVIEEAPRDAGGRIMWRCRCDCGGAKIIASRHLLSCATKSCGCLGAECRITLNTTHGLSKSPEYRAWKAMRNRCYRLAEKNYHRYGGRGIVVCERWHKFENFYSDMGARPTPKHSLDRRDNNGNYEPGNCRWATKKAQDNNRSTNHLIEIGGKTMNVTQWAEFTGVKRETIKERLRRGWTGESLITKPKVATCHVG